MAYEFLKKLFGTPAEGEAPKAMTYAELETALDAASDVQVVNLKDGGYVSKDKYDARTTELNGVKEQLTAANAEIQSYKDMDIDGIKQRAADWEEKYNTDTQALNDKLAAQERNFQIDRYFDGYKFTSTPARNGIRSEFEKKDFKLEDGKFLGADEFMQSLMENDDYKGAFVVETPAGQEEQPAGQNQGGGKPRFSGSVNNPTEHAGGKKMSLTEMMQRKNENPNFNPFG